MKKILLVLAHPRTTSLSYQAASAFKAAAEANGHKVEFADLVREGFDPVLHPDDEPDWNNPQKRYSPAVQREMARIERNDTTVILFPVWWWSMPAILKGWIDRVWNNGWAYGGGTYPHREVLAIAIAGTNRKDFSEGGYDQALRSQIERGLLSYCGVEQPRLEILYGALDGEARARDILVEVRRLGEAF